jgi:hypothetical protein
MESAFSGNANLNYSPWLRVRLQFSRGGGEPCYPSQHEAGHSENEERGPSAGEIFEAFGEPPAPPEPAECPVEIQRLGSILKPFGSDRLTISERQSHDCKRHGTTLAAALNVLDGTVIGHNMQRHHH